MDGGIFSTGEMHCYIHTVFGRAGLCGMAWGVQRGFFGCLQSSRGVGIVSLTGGLSELLYIGAMSPPSVQQSLYLHIARNYRLLELS